MQSIIIKALGSAAFMLVANATAQTAENSPFPSSAIEVGGVPLSAATLQYLEQKASRAAADTRRGESPFPRSSVGIASRVWSPEELRYWQQREAQIANEIKAAPPSGRFDYIPRSSVQRQ